MPATLKCPNISLSRTMFKRILLPALLVATILGSAHVEAATSSLNNPVFSHVLIIMFENRPINGTFGVVNQPGGPYPQYAPYITSLADSYGLAEAYYNVDRGGCGSITDYIGITNANVTGIDAACNAGGHCNNEYNITIGTSCIQYTLSIADRIEQAGLTWKSYHENMTTPCRLSGTADHMYDPGHNPWIYYNDIRNNPTNPTRCRDHVVPAGASGNTDGALLNDLNGANTANYMWLTPNDCNDMYIYCPGGVNSGTSCTHTDPSIQSTCVGEGDSYIKTLFPEIMNTQAWKSGSLALFLTWDEPTFQSSTQCPGYNPSVPYPSQPCQIPGIWIGPQVKQHYLSNTFFTHYGVLTTIENIWGLPALNKNDANATPMTGFFNPRPSDFTMSANPASVSTDMFLPGNSTINVSPVNGFAGTVSLTVSTNSTKLSCALSPTTITTSSSSTLQCSSGAAGNYLANVTGNSGSLSHSVGVTYHVAVLPPPFNVAAHVVVIILENQNLGNVYGGRCSSVDCGYITQLAAAYGLALGYSGVGHFSLPNYLTLTSGGNYSDNGGSCSTLPDTFSCDCTPLTCTTSLTGTNLMDTVEGSGMTWRAYMEDYAVAGGCLLSDATGGRIDPTSGVTDYDTSHNPFVYYTDITGNPNRCTNIVDANGSGSGYLSMPTALLGDLNGASAPNLMWLTPNKCNDGHDYGTSNCPVSDPVLEQNNYLEMLVPQILNSNLFKTQPSALYITWDEGTTCHVPGQTFPTCVDPVGAIWAGPTIKQGYQSTVAYSHYSFVTTLESLWNLTPLPIPGSVSAPPMLEFFGGSSSVGGTVLPVAKLALLVPILAASLVILGTVRIVLYRSARKKTSKHMVIPLTLVATLASDLFPSPAFFEPTS